MKIKRFLAGLLAAALLCGLMAAVPASAATGGASASLPQQQDRPLP